MTPVSATMALGIMQPYLFPYIGYFQLLHAVERFVVYDDVNYIKGGWVNRNNILLNGRAHRFTVPLSDASSFRTIREIELDQRQYPVWRTKFLKTVRETYAKAPQMTAVFPLVESVMRPDARYIAELARDSITAVKEYLGIATTIVPSSAIYGNADLQAGSRVIDICKREEAKTYVNAQGGRDLYRRDLFRQEGVTLRFIQPRLVPYKQAGQTFVPWLSIIDVLMFNTKEASRTLLDAYDLD